MGIQRPGILTMCFFHQASILPSWINKPPVRTFCSIWYRHTGGNTIHLIFKLSLVCSHSDSYVAAVLSLGVPKQALFCDKTYFSIHTTLQHPRSLSSDWHRPPPWMPSSACHPSHTQCPFQGVCCGFHTANSTQADNSFLIFAKSNQIWTNHLEDFFLA